MSLFTNRKMDLYIPSLNTYSRMKLFALAALFFLLSPGVILTLPKGSKGYFFSSQTSVTAAIVHALLFVILVAVFYYYIHEGFNDCCGCTEPPPPEPCNVPVPTCKPASKPKPKPEPECKEQTWFERLFGDSNSIHNI